MSLLDRVKRFAEARRAMLMEQTQADNEVDTTKVQWKGYNSDGLPVVKNGAKTEVADGQGLISNNQDKNMIYDKSGTVEYPKKKELILPRYEKKPLQIEKPRARKKKSTALLDSSAANIALAIIKRRVAYTVVVRYSWTTGTDLDNTTNIIAPISDGPVGWAHGSSTTYLSWSGDDTSSSGFETVTVDVDQIYEDHGVQNITITMRANWYSQAGTEANMSVKVVAEDGTEKERLVWTAPITYFERGGTGVPVGSVQIKPSGIITRLS